MTNLEDHNPYNLAISVIVWLQNLILCLSQDYHSSLQYCAIVILTKVPNASPLLLL